jgi:hypothetical protein
MVFLPWRHLVVARAATQEMAAGFRACQPGKGVDSIDLHEPSALYGRFLLVALHIPAYSPGSAVPICRLARRGVVGGVSDLLGEDVCVTGVAGDFTDHAQVDEAQAYCADDAVLGGVVEGVAGGDFI